MAGTLIRVIAKILAKLSRYQPIQRWVHLLASAYKASKAGGVPLTGYDIPEILPLTARAEGVQDGPRLNLLVPAISQRHVFGGIQTALQIFDSLRQQFSSARIILTDEVVPEIGSGSYYSDWPVVGLAEQGPLCNHIVPAGDRWGQTISIHAQDYFMATAWWTAHNAYALLRWQQACYPQVIGRRLVYLIQDYEPGFYSWSSRFVLAQATYSHADRTIALINSHWLGDYLSAQGHKFACRHVLEPHLHPKLAAIRSQLSVFEKQRQILVYGRPGTERNAFAVIVAGLRQWVQSYPDASKWAIIAAGEPFAPIELGKGCQLISLGKLDIEVYADVLARTAIGISLMVSPHPSYPPLEMAAFGARVLTNKFANKDLSTVSSSFLSLDCLNPERLSEELRTLTTKIDNLGGGQQRVDRAQIDWHGDFLQESDDTADLASRVATEVLAAGMMLSQVPTLP